jgi:uncharacterized protein YpmS
MALINPTLRHWAMVFLSLIAADIVLVVTNLIIITSIFAPETHGLAGAVTDTAARHDL